MQHLTRMLVEGHYNRLQSVSLCYFLHLVYKIAVTTMYTVEKPMVATEPAP